MAQRPEFLEFAARDARLGALRWPGLLGTPTVVAVHGITSNAWVWDPLAHHLLGGAQIVAVDLAGRGRSYKVGGPYGLRRHADDIATVIEALGEPVRLVGHSMGAFVALLVAEARPDLVLDVICVDGGTPLAAPRDGDVAAAVDDMFGAAVTRVATVWADRVSYQAMWASHPAFVDGISPDLERNLLADLIEVDGGFRSAVDTSAVVADATDLLGDDHVRGLLDRRSAPTTIVRAEFGMLGAPPAFIPPEVRDRYPQHRWVEAPGLNHYTVLNSSAGAGLVADAIRRNLNA